ncbi:amidohydrolase family protein [Aspergillus stella-maris]|uniref:amidohydrolase family protein n=1 Tax=Aspergillus stella-maris TaxID=1810926 RepID=UPI003CCE03ED
MNSTASPGVLFPDLTTHATGTEGIRRAAEAKFDSIEHCAWIGENGKAEFDAGVARRIVENGVAVCPTMNTACVEHDYFCPWDSRHVVVQSLTRLRESGATLHVGTDAGIPLCPFERYADGISVLGDAGYTPREIIAGATENEAAACRIADETGQLKVGLAADIVAFEGNPLEDLAAFGKPRFVMALGREHILSPIASVSDQSDLKATIRERLQQGGK